MSQKSENQITEEIFDEVKNFKGEFLDITEFKDWKVELENDGFVLDLNGVEKTYATLIKIRTEKISTIIKEIAGKELVEINPENIKDIMGVVSENMSEEKEDEFDQLNKEVKIIASLLWDSIYGRMKDGPDKSLTYHLTPGWKVYAGINNNPMEPEEMYRAVIIISSINGPVGDDEY